MAWEVRGTGQLAGVSGQGIQDVYGTDDYGRGAGGSATLGLYSHALPSSGGGFDLGAGSPSPSRVHSLDPYGGGDVYGFDLDGPGPTTKAVHAKPSAASRASKRDETLAMAAQILGHKSVNIPQAAVGRQSKAARTTQR